MSNETIENVAPEQEPTRPRARRKTSHSKKSTRRAGQSARKSKVRGANKKAEVIALMRRAKGATLGEIMTATGWQPHTVRGFVSILGTKGGEKIESSKSDADERTYHIPK